MAFQPLPIADIIASIKVVHDEPDKEPSKEEASQEPNLTFGPQPNTQGADFNLKKAVEHLPFKLNLDVPLEKEHQAEFINFTYSNQEVFSLHDKDLGYCDWLTYTIATSPTSLYISCIRQFWDNFRERCMNP